MEEAEEEDQKQNGSSEAPHTGNPEGPWPKDEELPCYRVYEQSQKIGSRLYPPGCYEHKFEGNGEDWRRLDRWLFAPLHVLALTTDGGDENYGLLLEFRSQRNVLKRYTMSRGMLMASDSTEAARALALMGLQIPAAHRKEVIKYLDWSKPKDFWRSVNASGWSPYPEAFVLPHTVIGKGEVCFQSEVRRTPYSERGTLAGWHHCLPPCSLTSRSWIATPCRPFHG
jgi:uncharacterized protein (DUF927 family)